MKTKYIKSSGKVHPSSKDISGNRYSRLVVLCRHGIFNSGSKHKQISTWECQCDCGTIIIVRRDHLKNNHTQSCGCLQKEKAKLSGLASALDDGEAAFNALILSYKRRIKNKKLPWSLTLEEAKTLFKSNCYYCGSEPSNTYNTSRTTGSFLYNGIDRLDPNIGYIQTNVVACCKKCNYAKHIMSYNDFITWIRRVYEHLGC